MKPVITSAVRSSGHQEHLKGIKVSQVLGRKLDSFDELLIMLTSIALAAGVERSQSNKSVALENAIERNDEEMKIVIVIDVIIIKLHQRELYKKIITIMSRYWGIHWLDRRGCNGAKQ
ncbi:hypothetical protein PoB_005921900 [Plakobranchus ocellatus]|uniref:Uncharacterized protein n=1 Tax=Plakobranchus ocellatus TaxID=259542 RepID=A0AAV4CN32_9GAST|nr:hypothetical protein PoB_005921900 [Plakobranchus ocellatus]